MRKEILMNNILDDFIFENYVVVGVSSGPDSMCLLHILKEKTDKIIVCHINHNVRKESITEENYLRDYCQKNNLIFESMTIKEYKENNFENEARKIRYSFYEKILNKYNSKYLFLAHHGDDLIETVLMKIIRGSNIEGYAGIKEKSKVKDYEIIRPLLKYTKEDIINYNNSHNITYFIDNSNEDLSYTRNRIRNKVLPLLKEEDKNIHKKFFKYSKTLEEYNNYIKNIVISNIDNVYKNNRINLTEFKKIDKFIQKNMLYYILIDVYDNKNDIIKENHILNIINLIDNSKPNQEINMPNGIMIIKEYNFLYIKKIQEKDKDYKIKFENVLKINNLEFKKVTSEDSDSNGICRLNSNNIKFPLYFRNRKNGDYIILKNSHFHKKIKEIFIEKKLPKSKRKKYPLLVDSEDNIIWIPNIKKSKFCLKKEENYDIIIKCNEREENYE